MFSSFVLDTLDGLRGLLPPKFRQKAISDSRVHALLSAVGIANDTLLHSSEGFSLEADTVLHRSFARFQDLALYEPALAGSLRSHLKEGMVAYDIGANIGVHTSRMALLVGPGGRVVAFEPDVRNYEYLRRNLAGYQCALVEDCAVAEKTGSVDLVHNGGVTGTRIGQIIKQGVETVGNGHRTRTVSLDDYVLSRSLPAPDLIKIDVEGAEFRVLRGMTRLLGDHPPIILCELHPHLESSVSEIPSFLSRLGYVVSKISNKTELNPGALEMILAVPA